MSKHQKHEDYHLGTSDEELHRLGFQHQAWQDVTEQLWRKAHFGFGQTLLDLGCGPGFATFELARLVGPGGRIEAVDAAATFLDRLRSGLEIAGLSQVRLQQADAHQIPLENESVDRIFVRWLMCFVENPARVCGEIARVLRPGGKVVIWDYFNYLSVDVFPQRAEIKRIFEAYYQSALQHHGSFDIGQFLPEMLLASGLQIDEFVPINRVVQPGSAIWHWVSLFHDSYLPKLVDNGLMSEGEAIAFKLAWEQAGNDPATFFFSPPMLGIIASKPA